MQHTIRNNNHNSKHQQKAGKNLRQVKFLYPWEKIKEQYQTESKIILSFSLTYSKKLDPQG